MTNRDKALVLRNKYTVERYQAQKNLYELDGSTKKVRTVRAKLSKEIFFKSFSISSFKYFTCASSFHPLCFINGLSYSKSICNFLIPQNGLPILKLSTLILPISILITNFNNYITSCSNNFTFSSCWCTWINSISCWGFDFKYFFAYNIAGMVFIFRATGVHRILKHWSSHILPVS